MPRRSEGFWATVIAEAKTSGLSHEQLARKHGVTAAALKYHWYKMRGSAGSAPTLLPVRVAGEPGRWLALELAGVTLRFAEGCDPDYVVAVVSRLR